MDPHSLSVDCIKDDWAEEGKGVRIYRVPNYIKDESPKDFAPHVLSVGLFTHSSLRSGNDLMHMDISKVAIAAKLFRGWNTEGSAADRWNEFLASLKTDLKISKESYDDLDCDEDKRPESDAVAALDALFVVVYLHYCQRFSDHWSSSFQGVFQHPRFRSQRFPVFRDLLVLDNQVPMSLLLGVIRHLSKSQIAPSQVLPEMQLYQMLEWFVMAVYPFTHGVDTDKLQIRLQEKHRIGTDTLQSCHHLLDCTYLALCGPPNPVLHDVSFKPGESPDTFPANRFRVPSATNLRRFGVSLGVSGNPFMIKSIKVERRFCYQKVLLMPRLIMNDSTSAILRNLALYEQISDKGCSTKGDIRTYMFLVNSLIDTVEDVRLLIRCGVIGNQLGNAEAVRSQWSRMCNGLDIPPSPPAWWSILQEHLYKHQTSILTRLLAPKQHGVSNFGLTILCLAICMVIVCTLTQAFTSVLNYTRY